MKKSSAPAQNRRAKLGVRGNVALMFALGAIALVGAVGAGVDLARASSDRARGQALLDAALLAPFSDEHYHDQLGDVQTAVTAYLSNNQTAAGGSISDAVVSAVANGYKADATFQSHPIFLSLFGINVLNQNISSTISINKVHLEVAFVLDTSGSMGGTKIASLISAMNNTLSQFSSWSGRFVSIKVSVVPFSNAVNVGPTNGGQSWMDTGGNSSVERQGFSQQVNRFALLSHLGESFSGCVVSRANGFDVTDEVPNTANPETLFVPWFWPDEPDGPEWYANNYLHDTPSVSTLAAARNVLKYGVTVPNPAWWLPMNFPINPLGFHGGPPYGSGPNFGCNAQTLLPMTTDLTAARTLVNGLTAQGGTNLTEGLAWGWRTLSSDAPFTEARPYGNDVRKVLIFLTDGNNEHHRQENVLGSESTADGYVADGAFGLNASATTDQIGAAMDGRTDQVCTNIKNRNIRVYTIQFGLSDARSEHVLKSCATREEYFFSPDNGSDLQVVFTEIARGLMQLHLSQ